ncbi:hypothetical protein [Methylobacterium sp. WSM2598]|uniref:hypothetical protein n=1 Tax=Methylobacterium sp. WSM2598 TaxID=398261 RepID=UPI00037EB62B|nr:hypothetical protein [Methylobacterium sp. WSM2598]
MKARSPRDAAARARRVEIQTAWRRRWPEKARAQNAVHHARRSGKLIPEPCERCGSNERVEAHHVDYREPLAVEWLCPAHHRAEHARLRAEARDRAARPAAPRARAQDESVAIL